SNIKCNFKSELESFNLDEERNVALFRIIQEALTNAIRHADANIIDVKIMQSKDNLDILVSDNGKGIRESSEIRTNSMGILGMKERTIFLGGKLNIESIEGEGTKIHLLIPFEKEPNPEG
ncbi:MAG: ATP-binding protein, partial [Melioribacteraceae bacterium]